MTNDDYAFVVHDTYTILYASAKACQLFRCELEDVVDRSIFDLIACEEFRWLSRLRMKALREHGRIPPVKLPFRRFDQTCFWALVEMTAVREDRTFEFMFHYESDAPCM